MWKEEIRKRLVLELLEKEDTYRKGSERLHDPDVPWVCNLRDFSFAKRSSAMSATMEGTFPRALASCLICIQCYEYRMSIRVQSFNVALSRNPSLARRWFIISLAKGSETSSQSEPLVPLPLSITLTLIVRFIPNVLYVRLIFIEIYI